MILSNLSSAEFAERLSGPGLKLCTGPFVISIRSRLETIAHGLSLLYDEYPLAADDQFVDYRLDIFQVGGLRHWIKPQVQFSFDGLQPFVPLPLNHAYPLFEWALNWCVAMHSHQYLIVHAAVIERGGKAAILPGPPGAGKSTLCAMLVNRGWRLLTDELALISLEDGMLQPIPRPVSLKNASIDIIKQRVPEATFGELFLDTKKGTVSHMKASSDSIALAQQAAQPAWIVMPRYLKGSITALRPTSKAGFCLHLANNAFNYNILDIDGFDALSGLVDRCDCYDFCYSDLDSAMEVFNSLEAPLES